MKAALDTRHLSKWFVGQSNQLGAWGQQILPGCEFEMTEHLKALNAVEKL